MPCRGRRRILTQVQLKTDHHAKINHGTALRIVNRIFPVIAPVAIMLPKVAGGRQESAPAGASPQHNPGLFVDATAAKGLNFRYLSSHTSKKYLLVETMDAGVALFDYDNDGRLDIFLVNGAPIAGPMPKGTVPNKTGSQYWNRAVPPEARRNVRRSNRESGPARRGLRDGSGRRRLRHDGYEDLYVTAYGRNRLYHNNGNGTFTDVTDQAGVGGGQRVGHRIPSAAPDGRDAKGPAQISGATGFSGHRADIPTGGSPSRP